jgi:hypothetical protein
MAIHNILCRNPRPEKCTACEQSHARAGVDVMITIFCDFPQFSAKKMGVFLKYHWYEQLFFNLALFRVKNANFFRKILRRKYSKNPNIGPRRYFMSVTNLSERQQPG